MVNWENTFREIERAKPEIAVLAIGAIEQHSAHLPVGTDFLQGNVLARRVADALGAYLLPTLPFSNSQEHQDFMGTIWLQPATLAQVVKDVCAALKSHGIRKVVVIDAHGGNWILKPTVREINLNDRSMTVILTGPGQFWAALRGPKIELHCGDTETGRMMAEFPKLVKGRSRDFHPRVGREYLDYVGVRAVSPTGVWGSPARATPALGRRWRSRRARSRTTSPGAPSAFASWAATPPCRALATRSYTTRWWKPAPSSGLRHLATSISR